MMVLGVDPVCWDGWMTRFTEDGRIDERFGARGKGARVSHYSRFLWPTDFVRQGRRFVVLGMYWPEPCAHPPYDRVSGSFIARLLPDGRLDKTFGPAVDFDGGAGVDFPDFEDTYDHRLHRLTSIDKLPNGKLIAVGSSRPPEGICCTILVARFNRDGTLDTDSDSDPDSHFAHVGWVRTFLSPLVTGADVVALPDGRIVVLATQHESEWGTDVAIVRYRKDGSIDESFGKDGVARVNLRQWDRPMSLILVRDRLVVGGTTGDATDPVGDWFISAFDLDGAPIQDFGENGTRVMHAQASVESSGWLQGLVGQPDGKVYAFGRRRDGVSERGAVIRLTRGGNLDPSFADGGIRQLSERYGFPNAATLDTEGRLLVYGQAYHPYEGGKTFIIRMRTGFRPPG
jgi:uncharacterized delta-60 repeat protein